MGITLNVWVFSGIIGVAYIMGYLMSRTMGRVLAIEGADPEAAQGEEAWAGGQRGGKREKSGKALFQAAAVLTGRAPRSEAAGMPGRASHPGAAEMPGRASRSGMAEMPGRASHPGAAEMPERASRSGMAEMPGRASRSGAAEVPGRASYPGAAEMPGRASRSGMAEMPGRASHPGAAEMSGRATNPDLAAQYGSAMRWEASATTWQEETEAPETAAWQDEPAMSERMAGRREMSMSGGMAGRREMSMSGGKAGREESVLSGGKAGREESVPSGGNAGREAAMMSGRPAWTGETDWEENTEPEGAVLQEARTRTERADRAPRQPYRAGHRGEGREWQRARIQRRYRGRSHREQQAKPAGHPIASPVAGQVDVLESQGRRGVLLTPEDNRVYAPASGKIIRLYPRGNEFLLRTDSGVVLRLRAGERDADMTRDYFRPRIMQNEFVGKGKLLLEYDREALARDGYDTHVSMTVEEGERSYDLSVTGSMWVKNGQDCLWVL